MGLRKWTALLLTVLLIFSLTACGNSAGSNTDLAKAGDIVITQSERDAYVNLLYYLYSYGADPEGMDEATRAEYEEGCLETLIDMAVWKQYFADVEDEIITDEVKAGIEEYIESATTNAGEFIKKYNISDDLLAKLYSADQYYNRVCQEIEGEIENLDELTAAYYEENKEDFATVTGSHILVETEEEAIDLKAQLDAGADFAELANEYSMDGDGTSGGSLGTFGKGQMVAPFEEAAFAMGIGEISEPVASDYGWHIIYITDKGYKSPSEAEGNIKNIFVSEKYDLKMEELREQIGVEYLD